jgi:hypothetical protein
MCLELPRKGLQTCLGSYVSAHKRNPDPQIIADTAPDQIHPYQYPMPAGGHSHIPLEASMRRDSNGSGNFLHANGPIGGGQGQPSTPQQLAQRSLDVDQGPDQIGVDLSSRKRSKVSRACDECRRKKVHFSPGASYSMAVN